MKKKNVAYVRVSRKDEMALENQVMLIKEYIKSNNFDELDDIYIDNGYSGVKKWHPALTKLKNDIKNGKIDKIYITDISRISRDIEIFVDFYYGHIRKNDIKLISIKDDVKDWDFFCSMVVYPRNVDNDYE